MKKLGLVMIIACLAIGMASAQGWGNGWGTDPQTISVTGTLQLRNGIIAVKSENNAYYVPALTQYIGFIEGLQEGAQINLDGFVSGNYLQPIKVTINGKIYDFSVNVLPQGIGYDSYGWGHHRGAYAQSGGWGRHGGGGCWW